MNPLRHCVGLLHGYWTDEPIQIIANYKRPYISSLKKQYIEDGYVVVKDALNPEQDIYPLQKAYTALLDALARIYLIETHAEALDRFDEMSLPERFAMSLGASRGTVLHHLDPVLNIFVPTFQWRKDLPDARIPEMFALMRHPKV